MTFGGVCVVGALDYVAVTSVEHSHASVTQYSEGGIVHLCVNI